MYRDKVSLTVERISAAYRLGSVEAYTSKWEGRAQREYRRGWVIYSSTPGLEAPRLGLEASGGGLAEASLYTGSRSMGVREVSPSDVEEAVKVIVDTARSAGCDVEAVVEYVVERLTITHSEGTASMAKGYTDVILSLVYRGATSSTRLGVLGFLEKPLLKLLRSIVEYKCGLAKAYSRARSLSPLYYGKWSIILYGEAAGALLHELGHALEATRPAFKPNTRLRVQQPLRIYDDPYYPLSPAWRPFDDEAVEAKRKILIEDDTIVNLLHTRETAYNMGGVPGNAWGLFHRPTPGHTTLVMEAGDWGEREIIEETRRGILVDQVVEAYVRDGVITIIPETAWLVESGEVKEPLKVSRIRIPVTKALETIDAISRIQRLRLSTERDRVQAEVAPTLRLQGYVD